MVGTSFGVRASIRAWATLLASCALLAGSGPAAAQSKESCLEAHGKGQDLRDAGKLSEAREQFLKCAQSACPSLVQSDCARFGEELQRIVPTVTFVARDAQGRDLVDVAVFVDDVQVTTKLAGKSFEVDPGSRAVRFVHEGKTLEQRVVISQGEKGRTIAVTFEAPTSATPAAPSESAPLVAQPSTERDSAPSRSVLPLVVAGIGLATGIVGGVLIGVGSSNVPDNCDFFAKECTAAPGDPVFADAKSAAGTVNAGVGLAAGGVAVAAIGVIWYFAQSPGESQPTRGRVLSPWLSAESGGMSFSGRF
jgi:hypothetical protein